MDSTWVVHDLHMTYTWLSHDLHRLAHEFKMTCKNSYLWLLVCDFMQLKDHPKQNQFQIPTEKYIPGEIYFALSIKTTLWEKEFLKSYILSYLGPSWHAPDRPG